MLKRALVLTLLAGCSSPQAAPAPAPAKEPAIQAASPEWQKIAEELSQGRTVGEQQKLMESERHYSLGLAWFNKADFEKARIEAQAAVEACPEHLAARKLLADVGEIIVGGPTGLRGIHDHELQVARVTVEQKQIEITNHILQGGRFLDAKLYSGALRELENAEFKIRNLPYDIVAMNDLLPRVREMLVRARSSSR